MIRFLIHTKYNLEGVSTEENPIIFQSVAIPEMVDTFMVICKREVADQIESHLEDNKVEYEILGSWNKNGEFYDDQKEQPKKRNKRDKPKTHKFNRKRFREFLKPKTNDKGDIVERDLTECVHIVNIGGWKRIKVHIDEYEEMVREVQEEPVEEIINKAAQVA